MAPGCSALARVTWFHGFREQRYITAHQTPASLGHDNRGPHGVTLMKAAPRRQAALAP